MIIPLAAVTPAPPPPSIVAVTAADDARFELLCVQPAGEWRQLLFWLPAMGMPARHYLPLAQALAELGVAVVLHEWRGVGSSSRRAGRRCDWGYRALLQDDLPAALAAVRTRWPQARRWVGGHSLGGQLGLLHASGHPHAYAGALLVASGAPYWRCFRWRWVVGAAYVAAPWLAAVCGYLPGRRIGFGGNEARALIADWARSGRSGGYAAAGCGDDFVQQLAALVLPVLGLRLQHDWLVPPASLDWLLGKLPPASVARQVITAPELGTDRADHFGWMKTPRPIAARIAAWIDAQPPMA